MQHRVHHNAAQGPPSCSTESTIMQYRVHHNEAQGPPSYSTGSTIMQHRVHHHAAQGPPSYSTRSTIMQHRVHHHTVQGPPTRSTGSTTMKYRVRCKKYAMRNPIKLNEVKISYTIILAFGSHIIYKIVTLQYILVSPSFTQSPVHTKQLPPFKLNANDELCVAIHKSTATDSI